MVRWLITSPAYKKGNLMENGRLKIVNGKWTDEHLTFKTQHLTFIHSIISSAFWGKVEISEVKLVRLACAKPGFESPYKFPGMELKCYLLMMIVSLTGVNPFPAFGFHFNSKSSSSTTEFIL